MKCTEFSDRLNDVLDLRLSPADDPALQSHAAACADCRELLGAQESLFLGMAQLRRSAVAPDLGRRVLGEIQPSPASIQLPALPNASRERRWLPLLASAAAVLLAVSFGVWLNSRNAGLPEAQGPLPAPRGSGDGLALVKPGTPRLKSTESPQEAMPLEAVAEAPRFVEPASPALPALDQNGEVYRQVVLFASRWPQAGQWPPVETLNVQHVEHYAPGIRPIRESFEVALDALLKTLPGKKDTARPAQPQALQPHGDWLNIA